MLDSFILTKIVMKYWIKEMVYIFIFCCIFLMNSQSKSGGGGHLICWYAYMLVPPPIDALESLYTVEKFYLIKMTGSLRFGCFRNLLLPANYVDSRTALVCINYQLTYLMIILHFFGTPNLIFAPTCPPKWKCLVTPLVWTANYV